MILTRLISGINKVFRIITAVIMKPFIAIARQFHNLSKGGKHVGKLPKGSGVLANVFKKPEKRSDFVDAGKVFLAKRTIIVLVVLVITLPLVFYFLIWPLILPLWFTARFTVDDPKYESYSGRVVIFYDRGKTKPMFEGRLLEGSYTEHGTLYYENGFVMYQGTFTEGVYDEFGRLYTEDAMMVYEGGFKMGLFDGNGTLYSSYDVMQYDGTFADGIYHGTGDLYGDDGYLLYRGGFDTGEFAGTGRLFAGSTVVYNGTFEGGVYHGTGDLYDIEGLLTYSGGFERGEYSGTGRLYMSGELVYAGEFLAGRAHGWGDMYDVSGIIVYTGEFRRGEKSGFGTEFNEDGSILYTGNFLAGQYNGQGTLNMQDGYTYEGLFAEGTANGSGRLLHNGMLLYTGEFIDGYAQGEGTLSHRSSGLRYTGHFEGGAIAPGDMFAAAPADIYTAFETGMNQHFTDTKFYVYNSAFGIALCFKYADEDNPARLISMLMSPGCMLPRVSDTEAPSIFMPPVVKSAYPDSEALSLLDIKIPENASAAGELRGTVIAVLWRSPDMDKLLYVFEDPALSDSVVSDEDADSEAMAYADEEHYEELALDGIVPGTEVELGTLASGRPPQAVPVPPLSATDAIALALDADTTIAGLRAEESNILRSIDDVLRPDRNSAIDGALAETVARLHRVWGEMDARSSRVAADVLLAIIAISTETEKQIELEKLTEGAAIWFNTAQTDFKTSRISTETMGMWRDIRDGIMRRVSVSNLQMNTGLSQFQRLTGHSMPPEFDLESAWLLVNAETLDPDYFSGQRVSMLFSSAGNLTPVRFGDFAGEFLNRANISLIDLHEVILQNSRANTRMAVVEEQFKTGIADKYTMYNAQYEQLLSQITVLDKKLEYGSLMIELDRASRGLISNAVREEGKLWFFDSHAVFDGRRNVSMSWMDSPGGWWRLLSTAEDSGNAALIVDEPWQSSGNARQVSFYYNGKQFAEGSIGSRIVFAPVGFAADSLIEAVFRDGDGKELFRAYIDGLMNAGRFFVE